MLMVCRPARFNGWLMQRGVPRGYDDLIAVPVDAEGHVKHEVVRDDYIDRGDQPWYGSGHVWISHAEGHTQYRSVDYDGDSSATYWRYPLWSDLDMTKYAPITYAKRTWATPPPITIDDRFSHKIDQNGIDDGWVIREYSGGQFVNVSAYKNSTTSGRYLVEYYRLPVVGEGSGQSIVRYKSWYTNAASAKAATEGALHSVPGGGTKDGESIRQGYMPIKYHADTGSRKVIAYLPNTTAYTRWRYFCEFGTTGDGRTNSYFGQAYLNAVENLPALMTNNIANLVELVKGAVAIYQIIRGNIPSTMTIPDPKTLSKDAWLAYRYQYCTTAADIKELAEYLDRIGSVGASARVKTGGSVTIDDVTYGCTMSVSAANVVPPGVIESLKSPYWMKTLGLALTPENIWDLVPFSFMVDWFLHIGDKLHNLTLRDRSFDLDVTDVWYTMRRTWTDPDSGNKYSIYSRCRGSGYTGLPIIITDESSSGKTWSKRIGDVVAIFG